MVQSFYEKKKVFEATNAIEEEEDTADDIDARLKEQRASD
jgi:hypothetical protein